MVEKLEWAQDGVDWIKTKCSNYYIYITSRGNFQLFTTPNGGLSLHSQYKVLQEAKDAAQVEDEAICVW
jgi:hypothetical protein